MNKASCVAITSVLAVGWGFYREPAKGQDRAPLLFPEDSFTEETMIVRTSSGDREVTYRSYLHIPYVANPVDTDYQSLNVSVPIRIAGVDIDATHAPIVLNITVGGYVSVNNATAGGRSGPSQGGGDATSVSSRQDLALAAGLVVVTPGVRGRDNVDSQGRYFGKAPAAIVDLKAAVRYLRHNDGVMPGNAEQIVSIGCSAGGALSALLGASGNNPYYHRYLDEIGAADASDHIYASACFSPIADLEHADMSYEWMYGATPGRSGLADQELSGQLIESYAEYQESLSLEGRDEFGVLTADNYGEYLLRYFLIPSVNKYLYALSDAEREGYMANHPWIRWTEDGAAFSFADYVTDVGRMKGLPAFDDFAMRSPETILFGSETTNARHFTDFTLRQTSGNPNAALDDDLKELVNSMNPMYFLGHGSNGVAGFWWLRNGTRDNHTSQTVMVNLATSLENLGKSVDAWVFWDGGHCADDDPEGLIAWIQDISGYSIRQVGEVG